MPRSELRCFLRVPRRTLTFAQPCVALSQKAFRAHEFDRAFRDASLKRCIELTDLVLCPLALSNIHDGANELKLPRGANQGTAYPPRKLDRSIREDDPILVFKIALVSHRPIEELFKRGPILRMNSLYEQRVGGRVGF